jgi:hypothetical protein
MVMIVDLFSIVYNAVNVPFTVEYLMGDRFEARGVVHPWQTLVCLSNPFNQKSFN